MEEMHHSVPAEEMWADDDIDGIGPKPYGTNNDGYKSDPKSRYEEEEEEEEEESDDGVFEFELERVMEKIHTHTAHCPNCSCQLTKVVLGGPKKEDILEMNVYFDNGEGITLRWSLLDNNVMNVEDLDIPKLVNDVIEKLGNDHVKDEEVFLSGLPAPRLRSRTRDQEDDIDVKIEIVLEESDDNQEEMREFDLFERAVDKLSKNTTAYCPYCSCQINKVIFRRKRRPPCVAVLPCDVTTKRVHEILPCGKTDLFGCLPSCFHFLLLCSGNKQENISLDEYDSTEALLSTSISDVDPLPDLRLSFSEDQIDTGLQKAKDDHEIITSYLPSGDVVMTTIDDARLQTRIPDHEIKDEEREINIVEYRMDGYSSSQITKITLRLLKKRRHDI